MTDTEKLALQARIRELREALAKQKQSHYSCEDCWYSCPMSEEGCCDDRQSGCTCGAEAANTKIDALLSRPDDLSALEAYVREEKRKSAVEVLLGAATICNAADKSTHPSDLADIFKRMAKELK